MLHVEGVDGGELGGPADGVGLEAVPGQRQTGQLHQARQQALVKETQQAACSRVIGRAMEKCSHVPSLGVRLAHGPRHTVRTGSGGVESEPGVKQARHANKEVQWHGFLTPVHYATDECSTLRVTCATLESLTSGNTEMLLFSRLSSSSSLHLAKDRGMADSRLYLRPRRFMLAKLPAATQETRVKL